MTKDEIENVTYDKFISLVKESIEPIEISDNILKCLKEFEGKKIDERIIKKIRILCNDDSIRLDQSYGMCHIDFGGYRFSGGKTGGSLLIGYGDLKPIINTVFIYDKNPAYYEARYRRNEQRRKILNDWVLSHEFVDALNEIISAKNKWHELETKYFKFEENCFVVQYEIKKLIKGEGE